MNQLRITLNLLHQRVCREGDVNRGVKVVFVVVGHTMEQTVLED